MAENQRIAVRRKRKLPALLMAVSGCDENAVLTHAIMEATEPRDAHCREGVFPKVLPPRREVEVALNQGRRQLAAHHAPRTDDDRLGKLGHGHWLCGTRSKYQRYK